MSDRGMKKWAPYKALTEQYDALEELHKSSEKVERPILSPDQEEEINDYLVNYHGQIAVISYYKSQRIREIETVIIKIDPENKRLVLPDRKSIYFNELVAIK